MFNELKLDCPITGRRHILLPRSAQPLFSGAYQELPLERALLLVLNAVTGRLAGPDVRVLRALGIREHPANLSRAELSARVSRVLFGIPRWQLLREAELPPTRVEASPKLVERPETPTAGLRSYVGVEVISNEGRPVPGVRIELTLPDGSVWSLVSDEHGRALVTEIESGTCSIALPGLDASRWRPSGGAHAVMRREPARTHAVRQGECLSQIAHQYGFDSWEKVWDDGGNADLKSKRKSPHVLLPGDEITLPGIEMAQVQRPTDAMHRLIVSVKELEVELVLTFKDSEGEPLKDEPYELTFQHAGTEQKRSRSLDGGGVLREILPVTVRSVRLSMPARDELYDVLLGHLDPGIDAESTPIESGAVARLRGLGFVSREPGEGAHLDLCAGIRAFQEQVLGRAEPTGELDAETCAKLEELYGS